MNRKELYEILLKKSVEKDIASVPRKSISRILNAIEDLKRIPMPHSSRKLSGSVSLYRSGLVSIAYSMKYVMKRNGLL